MSAFTPAIGIRLLVLEESVLDYDLLIATLGREGLQLRSRRVEDAGQLAEALASDPWDAVISDDQLPSASIPEALKLVRTRLPHCPFIILTTTAGADAAVVAMREGADDYLVKGRLARLVPALLNAIAAGNARRERAEAREALERSELQLRELLAHLETVVDEERTAIAREIHDDIGSALTALRLDMSWIRQHGDAASAARASQSMDTLAHVLDAALRLQQRLRPAILDQGLSAALRWLADDARRRSGMTVEFECNSDALNVDAPIALAVYRTLQESLTNIMKHAHASRVTISLVVASGELSLEIADNGRGISPQDRDKSKSFGLRGMSHRAAALGGWIEVSSLAQTPDGTDSDSGEPAGGTVVFLSLPLSATGAAVASSATSSTPAPGTGRQEFA